MKTKQFTLTGWRPFLVFLLAVFLTLPADAQQSDAAIRKKISAAASQMRSMQCDFVQTKTLKMLNEKLISKGRLAYQQTDKLRWEYTSPYQYTFIVNGSEVYIKSGQRADKINVNQSKVFKEIARIMMNSVVGRGISDSKDFKTTITSTSGGWAATLVPQRGDMKKMFSKIRLLFNPRSAMIQTVELYEQNGDHTVIQLRNVKTNVNLAASTFTLR